MTKLVVMGVLLCTGMAEARIGMGIVARCGTTACAGENTVCTGRLQSLDDEGNPWVALTLSAVVHNGDGSMTAVPNALMAPVLLPTKGSAITVPIAAPVAAADVGKVIAIDILGTGTAQLVPTSYHGRGTPLVEVIDCAAP